MSEPFNFIIFIPAYNCEKYIERCLRSVAVQEYPNWEVLVIDDASTDGTSTLMKSQVWPKKSTLVRNETNLKMPHNLRYLANRDYSPNDVVVLLDGDDFFPHKNVLDVLGSVYFHSDYWLTYGSFLRWPDPYYVPNQALPYPEDVIRNNAFRGHGISCYNHPLTFRMWLWDHIEDWELQDDEGEWFKAAYDHAIMIPMLELASRNHFKWVPDFLYVYNEENELSEHRTINEQDKVHGIIDNRPRRNPL